MKPIRHRGWLEKGTGSLKLLYSGGPKMLTSWVSGPMASMVKVVEDLLGT